MELKLPVGALLPCLLLSCTLGQIACTRHGPTAAVEQRESVTDEPFAPGDISRHLPADDLSLPVRRILSVENYLNYLSDEEQEESETKGAPQSPFQSVNYIQSHTIGEKRGADGNCVVYTLNPCQAEGSCQQPNRRRRGTQLRHVEVWLPTTCVRSLTGESELNAINISVTVSHHLPGASHGSSRSRQVGMSWIDVSPSGAAAQPWILVGLHHISHFVEFAFKRSRPIYLQICPRWNQGNMSNHSEPPMPPVDPKAFFLTFYQRQALSLADFIETAKVRVSMTRPDEVVRRRRSAESTEMSSDLPTEPTDISSTAVNISEEESTVTSESTPTTSRGNNLPIDHQLHSNDPVQPRDLCGLTEFTLHLSSIDSGIVYSPSSLNLTACVGACTDAVDPATTFASLQRLTRSGSNPDPNLRQSECCVPKTFGPPSRHGGVLIQEGSVTKYAQLDSLRVTSCGCT